MLKELAKDIWSRPWSEERRNDSEMTGAGDQQLHTHDNAAKMIGKRLYLYGILSAMVYQTEMRRL